MTPFHSPQEISRQTPAALHREDDETVPLDEASATDAAQALREVEVQAADPDAAPAGRDQLDRMNIDELRELAKRLDVPDREKITDRDKLVAAIRKRR